MSKELVIVEKEQLISMANAVRGATGSSDNFNAGELSDVVVTVLGQGGGEDVSEEVDEYTRLVNELEATIEQLPVPYPKAILSSPTIEVSSSGLITSTISQPASQVEEQTVSTTKQLLTQGAQVWTPSTANQTIPANTYLTGAQTIKGDSNLIPANIAKGTSIFGVEGTMEGGGVQLETCQVQVTGSGSSKDIFSIAYITVENEQIQLKTIYVPFNITAFLPQAFPNGLTCLKNSIVVLDTEYQGAAFVWPDWLTSSGGVTHRTATSGNTYGYHFTVAGDGTITIN